mgnify:CR=1 FL=1
MVFKRRSRNTRNTRNTRRTKRTIKRVRKKKYSRKKKSNVLKRNKKQMGGAAVEASPPPYVEGAGAAGEVGNLSRVGLEMEVCITLPEGVNNAFKYLNDKRLLTDEEMSRVIVKDFRDYFSHSEHLQKYQEFILFTPTTDTSISCQERAAFATTKQSVEFIFKEDLTILHDGTIFKKKQEEGSIVECHSDFLTDLTNMLEGPSQITGCLTTGCCVHVHMSPLTPSGVPDNSFKLNTKEGKIIVLNTILLWCGIPGYRRGYQERFRELGYIRDPSECPNPFKGGSLLDKPTYGRGINVQDLAQMYNLINMGDENIDMIFIRYVILLMTGNVNPFISAKNMAIPLSAGQRANPKYFNLNCYYFEDIWNLIKGVNPEDINEDLLLSVQETLNKVARFEFRGAGHIFSECFKRGRDATPENIYDGINTYVSLLHRFCTHAKSLHLSELFQSFLSQVAGFNNNPPPEEPTRADLKSLGLARFQAKMNEYGKILKEYRPVDIPPEFEAIINVEI